MCMVAPNPCLFNKSFALKGVNLAKIMEDHLAFVFGESRPKFCHEAGLLPFAFSHKTIINLHFFLFSMGFFTDFCLGFLGLAFLLNFLINLFPSHRIRLRMITPPKNPPPPGFKMILRLTSGSTIALANFRTSS